MCQYWHLQKQNCDVCGYPAPAGAAASLTAQDALQVYNVEGGDHSLKVKGGKAAAESAVTRAIKAAVTFAKDVTDSIQEDESTREAPPSPEPESGVRRSRRPKHPPKRKADTAPEDVLATATKSQKQKV